MPLKVKRLDSQEETEAARILRTQVFVDEQGVPPELEVDQFDDSAIHAVAYESGKVIATGRLILDTSISAHIGRMAVQKSLRRSGVGSAVLVFLENEAWSHGIKQLNLHAQDYVKDFYAQHGYKEFGETFLEAGIVHVQMKKDIA